MIDGPLDLLIKQLSSLPGLGRRSAKRIALHLLTHKDTQMLPLAKNLSHTAEIIQTCDSCGNLDEGEICRICRDPKRDRETICVVASVADLWAVERTRSYRGIYHVLGGVLSALDGVGPKDLAIESLVSNVAENNCKEVILALSATVDGQSTAHYITDLLNKPDIKITRLAHGMPVGGELDYLDDGTISTALKARANL
ncbi:MAG TPA: recombination mediator RecR [Alphaproteobacteria bacterium]|nr:recombination mediator RecR [Alphaproteobacteria bacterium]